MRRRGIFVEDQPSWLSPDGRWGMCGASVGGIYTGFVGTGILKDIFFDAGLPTEHSPRAVLLTHSHADHSNALAEICKGDHGRQFTVYAPQQAVGSISAYIIAYEKMVCCGDERYAGYTWHGIEGVIPTDLIHVTDLLTAKILLMQHDVPCVGYVLFHAKKILDPQFAKLSQAEIVALARSGQIMSRELNVPLMAYYGDTAITAVRAMFAGQCTFPPVIFVECTWLTPRVDDDSVVETSDHCDWENLHPIVAQHPETTFVLIHFSSRYTPTQIVDVLETGIFWDCDCIVATMMPNLKYTGSNLVVWASDGPHTIKAKCN